MSTILGQPPGLDRARAFLTSARELSIEYSESVTRSRGQQPERVTAQFDAAMFDYLLADIETGERAHEMDLRLAEEHAQRMYDCAQAWCRRCDTAESLLRFERVAFLTSLVSVAVFIFMAFSSWFGGGL